jgi:ABC-2 type transport system ATP-binding protein
VARLPSNPPPAEAAVLVSGLVKSYRGGAAVAGLRMRAVRGAVTALLGPNGAGKTTTVECCEGLRHPDRGTVRVLGCDPRTDGRALRPRVGVMLQDGGLPSTVRAGLVLRHVAAMYAEPRDVGELAERLGIDAFASTQVRRLSGGERQRLALAAAVVGRPEVAFLDEPTAGLDPQARLAVWDLVAELAAGGTTIVLTTHQMAEAEELADHVVIVDHGTDVASGSVADLIGVTGTVRVTLPADPARDAETLARSLARALGRRRSAPPVLPATGGLEVRADADPELLHAITGWARDTGLLIGLADGRRTLEDVFLELTGRRLR